MNKIDNFNININREFWRYVAECDCHFKVYRISGCLNVILTNGPLKPFFVY